MDVQRLGHPCPGSKNITQGFGDGDYSEWGLKGHNGIDWATPMGQSVHAMHDGVVVHGESPGYGKYIYVVGVYGDSVYAHLSERFVSRGSTVAIGELIGRSGQSGNATGPHLHAGYRPRPFQLNDGYRGYVNFWNIILKATTNKIVPHCQGYPYPAWLEDSLHDARGKIPYICLIDPSETDRFPFQRTIGRLWLGSDQRERAYVRDGRQGGQYYYDLVRPRYQYSPYVWAWRGPNEFPVNTAADRRLLVEFYKGFLPLAHKDGYRIVGPECGVTWPGGYCPPQPNWTEFIKHDVAEMRWIYENVDYCSGHHYGLRSDSLWTQWDGWTFRFRHVIQALKEMDADLKPWLLTEGGLDIKGDPKTSGWRGPGHNNPVLYTKQLLTVNRGLQQDAKVFCYACFGFTETGWPSFSHDQDLWRSLYPMIDKFPVRLSPDPIEDLAIVLDDRLRHVEIPITETHALFKEAMRLWPGCWPKSDEITVDLDGRPIVAQRFYDPETRQKHTIFTIMGDWDPTHFRSFTVDN